MFLAQEAAYYAELYHPTVDWLRTKSEHLPVTKLNRSLTSDPFESPGLGYEFRLSPLSSPLQAGLQRSGSWQAAAHTLRQRHIFLLFFKLGSAMIPTCCCLRQRPGLALQVLIIQETGHRGSDRQQRGDQQEHLLSTLRAHGSLWAAEGRGASWGGTSSPPLEHEDY